MILRYLAGSLGQGMAGKIVELRAALLVSGAVRLIHPGTERNFGEVEVDVEGSQKKPLLNFIEENRRVASLDFQRVRGNGFLG